MDGLTAATSPAALLPACGPAARYRLCIHVRANEDAIHVLNSGAYGAKSRNLTEPSTASMSVESSLMRRINCQTPIELKLPSCESPLRRLVWLYFAYAHAADRRSGQAKKRLNSARRHVA